MRILALVFAAAVNTAMNATLTSAHPSIVPHQHPHAASLLPDALALVMAALVVGFGVVALRRIRKE